MAGLGPHRLLRHGHWASWDGQDKLLMGKKMIGVCRGEQQFVRQG